MTFPKGSEWRKWDLHVHTDKSSGFSGKPEDLIKNLQNCEADVIGLNDYYTIDGFVNIANKIPQKVIFPIVEFRSNNLISHRSNSVSSKLNFHLIFDNTLEIGVIQNFLNSLKFINNKGATDLLANIPLSDYPNISINYFDVVEELNGLSLRDRVLIWVPYNEYGGIDGIPASDYLKLGIIKPADVIGTSNPDEINFFLWKNKKFTETQYEKWFGRKLPSIKGSDSHDATYPIGRLRDSASQPIEKYCWIKSDPTFEGLKQILVEPEERVFIGKEPSVITEVKSNKALYINSLSLTATNKTPEWFDDFPTLSFNPGLIAVIGNKGSGKSALADILALTGNSHKSTFTFLTDEKFLKSPAAKKYTAQIDFWDNFKNCKTLFEKPDLAKTEKVIYLSQHFVNQICDIEEDNQNFKNEINNVIFSHLPEENRIGKKTLRELVDTKVKANTERRDELTTQMYGLNKEIVDLELKLEASYQESINNTLQELERQLNELEKEPPVKVEKPKDDSTLTTTSDIAKLTEKIIQLESEFNLSQTNLNLIVVEQSEFIEITDRLSSFKDRFSELSDSLKRNPLLTKYAIKAGDVFKLDYDPTPILEAVATLQEKQNAIQLKIKQVEEEKIKVTASIDSLRAKITGAQKLYQNYIQALEAWEKKKAILNGTTSTPGTIQFLKAELGHVAVEYPKKLESLCQQRNVLANNILKHVSLQQNILTEIYKPMLEKLDEECKHFNISADEFAKFQATMVFSPDFEIKFFEYITSRTRGAFCGREDAQKVLKQFKKDIDLSDADSILKLPQQLIATLKSSVDDDPDKKGSKRQTIEKQLKEGKSRLDLYYFLFSFRYIKPEFAITFADKKIEQLSPGEKGLLLLIFYLVVSKDRLPIIIDQPEENLDNETVYKKLVPFIRAAKKLRQIIIVTHNPNLAVVCDAEQVVYAKMGKHNNNQISYYSGSLENPQIKKHALDVLEGTKPAFNNRRQKYAKELGPN